VRHALKVAGAAVPLQFLALAGYVFSGRAYMAEHVPMSAHSYDVDGGFPPLNFTAAEGDQITLVVKTSSTNGYWASDSGLQLLVPNRPPITIGAPGKPSWPDEIETSVKSSVDDVIVCGTFTLADSKRKDQ
jgi:hypothetical protein